MKYFYGEKRTCILYFVIIVARGFKNNFELYKF